MNGKKKKLREKIGAWLYNFFMSDEKLTLQGSLTLLAAAAAVLYPSMQFYESLKSYKIAAKCNYSFYSLPDTVKNSIKKFETFIPEVSIKERYPQVIIDDLTKIQSLWSFNFSNKGKKEVKTIKLQFPTSGLYRVTRSNAPSRENYFNKGFDIGSLHPEFEIEILLWSFKELKQIAMDSIKASHSEGSIGIDFPKKI